MNETLTQNDYQENVLTILGLKINPDKIENHRLKEALNRFNSKRIFRVCL